MGAYSWKVHGDVPQTIISKRGQTFLEVLRTETDDWRSQGAWYDDMVYEPLIPGYMLRPRFAPWVVSYLPEYYWVYPTDETVGIEWIGIQDCWGEGGGRWLCRRNALWAGNTYRSWAAYLAPGYATLEADRGIYYDLYMLPPSGTPTTPELNYITFYPRVDLNYGTSYDSDSLTVFWAPYRAVLTTNSLILQVNVSATPTNPTVGVGVDPSAAYEGDDYTTCYVHPLRDKMDIATEFFSKRQKIFFLPIGNKRLLVKADFLEDGGFVYTTDVEHDGFEFFPVGSAGVQVSQGGSAILNFVPAYFPSEGEFWGSKRELNTPENYTFAEASIDFTTYAPPAASYGVSGEVRDGDGDTPTPTDVIHEHRYYFYAMGHNKYTPVIEDVKLLFGGHTVEKTFTPSYIQDDILSLEESVSGEQGAMEVTMELADDASHGDGTYAAWADRASIAFDYDWLDGDTTIHRAMLYMDSVEYDEESPILRLTARDGWKRLENIKLGGVSKGDGKMYTAYIKELLEWAGWPDDKINIYTDDAFTLPASGGGQDSAWEPRPGVSLADFIRQMHRDFAVQDRMYIDGDGVFTIERGEDFTATSSKTFYWTHDDALAAGDWFATIDRGTWREKTDIESYRNLIVVIGEIQGKGPVGSYWADVPSVADETSDRYVGEWRLLIYINSGFRTQQVCNRVCRSLAMNYGKLRKTAEFSSTFYPELRRGDFIVIDGKGVDLWEIEGVRYRIDAGSEFTDDEYGTGERIAHAQYTIREWVDPFPKEE